MHSKAFLITFILFLLIAPAIVQTAEPYEINPAKWIFYLKEDYELKPIYFNFIIKNTETEAIAVSLRTIPPEYLYDDQYPDIVPFPDYSWITIAESNIIVPAGKTVEVPVYVNIPSQYFPGESNTAVSNYNKSYEAWFYADQTDGPGNIQVDYRCRWVFLTPTRFVPTWERPGALLPFPTEYLYVAILLIVIVIAIVFLIRRRGSKGSSKPHRKKEQETKQKPMTSDVWED